MGAGPPLAHPLIGCCGWAGAQARYFSQFPVIEIQSTFYDPPDSKVAARWRALAPPDFVFCIKAWPPELVHDLCAEYGLIHCVDPFINHSVYDDQLYWRLHGSGSYSYVYSDQELAELKSWFLRSQTHLAD